MDSDREKWDAKYRAGSHASREPEPVVLRAIELAEPGDALDVACGRGRHAVALARAGFAVDAVDISAVGLAKAKEAGVAGIRWIEADLDTYEFATYDLIVCVDFTDEQLLSRLLAALRPGGWMVYAGRPRARCSYGPRPGDVARWFAALETHHHVEDEDRVEFIGRR